MVDGICPMKNSPCPDECGGKWWNVELSACALLWAVVRCAPAAVPPLTKAQRQEKP